MSDPSSTFVAAAFVAGVIEGSSIFRHYRNVPTSDDATPSVNTPNLAAHSVLYGAVSLPLGIIGASPGIVFYPKGLKRSNDARASSHRVHSPERDSLDKAPAESSASRGSEMRETPIKPSADSTPMISGTGRGIGRLLRQENLKKNLQTGNNNTTHLPEIGEPSFVGAVGQTTAAAPPSKTASPKSSRLSRYISTLDGRLLPTPLSEAMRRSRSVLLGAALVSFAVARYLPSECKEKGARSNEDVAYRSIIDEYGKIDCNHGYELQRRLRADMALAAAKPDALVGKILSSICHEANAFSKKAQQLLLNGLCSSIELIQLQLGRSVDVPPIDWLFQRRDDVSVELNDEYMARPIAIRLLLNDENNIHSFPTGGYSPFPWLAQNKAKNDDNMNDTDQQHNHFFVLPVHFSRSRSAFNQMNKPLVMSRQISPWWEMDSVAKPLKDLPLNSSWLFNLHQQQGFIGKDTQSKSATRFTNASSSGSLIVEANTCPPVYDMLQRRYSDENSPSNNHFPSGSVAALTRMLLSLVKTNCLNSVASPSASSILIHCDDKVDLKERVAKSWNEVVYIDALDVFKWALVSTINNISLELEPTFDHTILTDCADKSDVNPVEPTLSTNDSSDSTSEFPLDAKYTATPWTYVDVLGTSIRHLLESTYRIASAVTYLGRREVLAVNTLTNSIPKVIHFVSHCNSSWLKESLVPFGWEVRHHAPDETAKNDNLSGGVVLVLGVNDVETCELTCSLLERSHIQKDPSTKLLVILDDSSMLEMMHNMIKQVEHSQEDIADGITTAATRLKDHPTNKIIAFCPSFVYEYAFAVARGLIASGANTEEVQFEVEKRVHNSGN